MNLDPGKLAITGNVDIKPISGAGNYGNGALEVMTNNSDVLYSQRGLFKEGAGTSKYAKNIWQYDSLTNITNAINPDNAANISYLLGNIKRGKDGKYYIPNLNEPATTINSYDGSAFTGSINVGLTAYKFSSSLPTQVWKLYSDPTQTVSSYGRVVGEKSYELKDHLANVKVVISDVKLCINTNSNTSIDNADSYEPEVLSYRDYFAFGQDLPGRKYSSTSNYRYSYNGKEDDGENFDRQDYGMRINDKRLGKFLSVDPLTSSYPMLTPYQFASNSPIAGVDLDGLEFSLKIKSQDFTKSLLRLINDKNTLDQGNSQTCTIESFLLIWMSIDREGFIKTAIDLFAHGKATINGYEIEPNSDLFEVSPKDEKFPYSDEKEYGPNPERFSADWIMISSIQDVISKRRGQGRYSGLSDDKLKGNYSSDLEYLLSNYLGLKEVNTKNYNGESTLSVLKEFEKRKSEGFYQVMAVHPEFINLFFGNTTEMDRHHMVYLGNLQMNKIDGKLVIRLKCKHGVTSRPLLSLKKILKNILKELLMVKKMRKSNLKNVIWIIPMFFQFCTNTNVKLNSEEELNQCDSIERNPIRVKIPCKEDNLKLVFEYYHKGSNYSKKLKENVQSVSITSEDEGNKYWVKLDDLLSTNYDYIIKVPNKCGDTILYYLSYLHMGFKKVSKDGKICSLRHYCINNDTVYNTNIDLR